MIVYFLQFFVSKTKLSTKFFVFIERFFISCMIFSLTRRADIKKSLEIHSYTGLMAADVKKVVYMGWKCIIWEIKSGRLET